MRLPALLAAGWLLTSCASPTAGNGAPAPSSAQTPPPASSAAPPPAAGPAIAAVLAGSGTGSLAPPAEPGASRSSVSGCLTAASEADASRFPAPPASRHPSPQVTAVAVPGGAVVTHELSHACCLSSQVTTTLSGRRAVVREVLTGSPCRCMCASTLRTAVALPPGTWTVAVELVTGGGEGKLVAEVSVEVR